MKVGFVGNIFILGFQKIPVFWLMWLTQDFNLRLLLILTYFTIIFVLINLLLVTDIWLLLVYSSIVNTGLLLIRVWGSHFIFAVFLYLIVVILIIFILIKINSNFDLLIVVFLFLIVPPFVLFFIKFFIVLRLDRILKLVLLLFLLDVLILFYYFTLIFIKFFLIDNRILIYFINFFILFRVLFFSNCVTLIIFY